VIFWRTVRQRTLLLLIAAFLGVWGALFAQKPFKQYPGGQDGDVPLPPDYAKPAEWTVARLRYRDLRSGSSTRGYYREGAWGTDYPLGDRHLSEGLRRLTKVNAQSVEQVVELDGSDDIFNWPFLYAVEVGQWTLNEKEGAQLRDFLDRGGFLMVDDFHGTYQWDVFQEGIKQVFPERPIVDLDPSAPIFRILNEVDTKVQVPGMQFLRTGRTYEQASDPYPRWRAIHDQKERVVVAICHNMDLGDAWEFSDDPRYPADFAIVAHRVLQNYAVYDLSH
jgi:hypothetical protein